MYTKSGGFGLGPLSRQYAEPEPPGEHSCHGEYREPDVPYRNRVAWVVKRRPEDNKKLRFGAVQGLFRECVHISQYDGSESYYVRYADVLLTQLRKWEREEQAGTEELGTEEQARRYRELVRLAGLVPTHRMRDRSMYGNLVWSEFEDPGMLEYARRLNSELDEIERLENERQSEKWRDDGLFDWLRFKRSGSKRSESKRSESEARRAAPEPAEAQPGRSENLDAEWKVVSRRKKTRQHVRAPSAEGTHTMNLRTRRSTRRPLQ